MLIYSIVIHTIMDFLLQSNSMVKRKKTKNNTREQIIGCLEHSGTIFLGMIFGIVFIKQYYIYAFYCFLITLFHFICDFTKVRVDNRWTSFKPIYFVIDQLIHIIIIIVLSSIFNFEYNNWYFILKEIIGNNNLTTNFITNGDIYIFIKNSITLFIIGIYVCKAGEYFIREVLEFIENVDGNNQKKDLFDEETIIKLKNTQKENKKYGKYIGILERLIIYILTIYGQFTSIAFVITAKSITRSTKIEKEPQFGERYLVGTLLSVVIAIMGGCLFNIIKITK